MALFFGPSAQTTIMEEKTKQKENENEEEEAFMKGPHTITTYVTVPPDGGWGWVIVAASFVCNMVVDGIVFSFGPLLVPIATEFKVSQSQATIAGSLLSGFYLISGPFVSALANRYGFRFTGVVGSISAGFIFAIASLAPSIHFLWLFYGILGGLGFGMIYVPAVITTGFYFEKWRALATGISVTGTGIGTIVMGPLTTFLIREFGWRGALLAQAGMVLCCALFSALYRPLKPIRVSVPNPDIENGEDKLPLLERIRRARDILKRTYSTISIDNEIGITAVEPYHTTILRANNNSTYPTASEIFNRGGDTAKDAPRKKYKNTRFSVTTAEKRHSVPNNETIAKKKVKDEDYDALKEENGDEDTGTHIHDDVFYIPKKPVKTPEPRRDSITFKYRSRTMSDSSYRPRRPSNHQRTIHAGVGVRPLYRDDIFFAASLSRLPQYASRGSGLDYTMTVSRLPTAKDVQEEEDAICQLCPEAVRRTLATMLDMTLLKSPVFMLFAFAGFVTMLGIFIPFLFLAGRAVSFGYKGDKAVFLVSTIGITNTIGRIMCGALTSVPGISALAINNIALTIGGLATMCSGYSDSETFQFAYAAIFGLSISCWASLRSIIAVDLIGIEKLTNAFGIILMFQGFAATLGSPIAGMLYDITGSYDMSFYLSGGLLLFSGVICYPLNYLKDKLENQKSSKTDIGDTAPC